MTHIITHRVLSGQFINVVHYVLDERDIILNYCLVMHRGKGMTYLGVWGDIQKKLICEILKFLLYEFVILGGPRTLSNPQESPTPVLVQVVIIMHTVNG